jgi:hypothetical protein
LQKADKTANFAAGGIINRRTHHNSFCRDKNRHYVTRCPMVYKATSHVMLPHMRELSPASILVDSNKRKLLSK